VIPKDYITEWRDQAPWVSDAQVEQDLVISRAVVELFRVCELAQRLAFRGGTALFRLHLRPAVRYSEDIDLVQVTPEPIGNTFDAIRDVLDPWLGPPRRDVKEGGVTLTYRFSSEDQPPRPMRLKIEINSREHFTELGYVQASLAIDSRWWCGSADVTTFALEEMLGTKLRALYQRKKARDLFDLWYGLAARSASGERIVACFERYMREGGQRVSRTMFEENLMNKVKTATFRADLVPLLRPGVAWDIEEAARIVMAELIARLPGQPWRPPTR
jgi:predicted nucleotidyltransferase component of viral defense system